MKFITVSGGLGNQMFMNAFCESFRAKGHHSVLFIPYVNKSKAYGHQGYELGKLFNIKPTQTTYELIFLKFVVFYSHVLRFFPATKRPFLYRLIGVRIVSVPENFIFYPEVFNSSNKHELFRGTWQSQHYFNDAMEKVRNAYQFNAVLLSSITKELAGQMKNNLCVSIHIRRGDYLSTEFANGFAGVCTIEYYQQAIRLIQSRVNNPTFYVFTDDQNWVSSNFIIENAVYVQHNVRDESWQDMYLMSQCKHNIIANSSFSWWGAWLNPNPDKIVIAPKKWWKLFNNDDVVPESWIRI